MRKPEKRWLDELKRYDRFLFYVWDPAIGRWVVMREDPFSREGDEPTIYQVYVVKGSMGEYRDMDMRVISELHRRDMQQKTNAQRTSDMLDDRARWLERQRALTMDRDQQRLEQYIRDNYRELKWAGVRV